MAEFRNQIEAEHALFMDALRLLPECSKHFSRTAFEEPKPWMLAWPEPLRPTRKPPPPPPLEPMALFEQGPTQATSEK